MISKADVYADLAEIVVGKKPGRTNDTEITIFDSTGIALEDAVVAVAVYEKARNQTAGSGFAFAA